MAKRANKRKRQELNWQGIAILVGVVALAYILYTNLLTLIIATFGTVIVLAIIVIVGAYFILPRIGITGLAALLNIKK